MELSSRKTISRSMIDDWPHVQREAAVLMENFGSHSLVQFLAWVNRSMTDTEAPIGVDDLCWAIDQAVKRARERVAEPAEDTSWRY